MADESDIKPAGHALLEKIYAHHKELLDGIKGEIGGIDPQMGEMRNGILTHAMACQKSLEGLHSEHGKGYKGLEVPAWPDELDKPKEKAASEENADEDEQLRDVENEENEEELAEEDVKAFEAKIKELEEVVTKNDQRIKQLQTA